jgi:hypothetical protein
MLTGVGARHTQEFKYREPTLIGIRGFRTNGDVRQGHESRRRRGTIIVGFAGWIRGRQPPQAGHDVALCDETYEPVEPPVVIDLD